jgi:hypothetical protein
MWNWTQLTINVKQPGAAAAAVTDKHVQLVGGNTIAALDPCPARNCRYSGVDGVAGVLAYGGMAVAPQYGAKGALVIHGGGHADYGGNEVYVFDLAAAKWTRINNPSPAAAPDTDPGVDVAHGEYSDGSPMAAHTYDVMRVIPGGSSGTLIRCAGPSLVGSGGRNAPWSHACDLATGKWTRYSRNAAPTFSDKVADATCYDAGRNRIWELYRGGFHTTFAYLDLSTQMHVPVRITASNFGYNPCAAQVPVHDLMLFVTGVYGVTAGLTLGAMDLSNPGLGMATLKLAGDVIPSQASPPWGFDWDTDADHGYVYGGDNDASSIYRIDPPSGSLFNDPWTVTRIPLSAPLPTSGADGVYGHWRYVPSIKAFAYVSKVTNQVALYTP